MKYIINSLTRLFTFPHENDERLRIEFRRRSLIGIETTLHKLDVSQLVQLMNACMELIQRPYCDKETLIKTIEWFAPRDKFDTTSLPTFPLLSIKNKNNIATNKLNNNLIQSKTKDMKSQKNHLTDSNKISEVKINQGIFLINFF